MNPLDKQVYEKIARKVEKNHIVSIHNYNDANDTYEIEYNSTMYFDMYEILLSDVLHFIHYKLMNTDGLVNSILWGNNNIAVSSWDFRKPTYKEQSEECKDFIRNIVK